MMIISDTISNALYKQGISNTDVLEILRTGSYILKSKITEAKDVDYIILVRNYIKLKSKIVVKDDNGIIHDMFIYDVNFYKKQLCFEVDNESTYYAFFYLISERIFGVQSIDWDIFKYKEQYVDKIRRYIVPYGFSPNMKYTKISFKTHVGAYIVLKFFESMTTDISEDMFLAIQRIYTEEADDISEWIGSKLGLTLQHKYNKERRTR